MLRQPSEGGEWMDVEAVIRKQCVPCPAGHRAITGCIDVVYL